MHSRKQSQRKKGSKDLPPNITLKADGCCRQLEQNAVGREGAGTEAGHTAQHAHHAMLEMTERMTYYFGNFKDIGQEKLNTSLNANFKAASNANGMLQTIPAPKVQRQWEAVSTPMGGIQIPTPTAACHIQA